MHQLVENTVYCLWTTEERVGDPSLWDRILGLLEQDLAERRSRKLFVEMQDESGSHRKEIGELSASERQSFPPTLREHVVERLLDRYLAEQGRVDLADKRRAYTKKIQDLTPADLPALIEADRLRAEEYRKERELAELAQDVEEDLDQLHVIEFAQKTGGKEDR